MKKRSCKKCGEEEGIGIRYIHLPILDKEFLEVTCLKCKYSWEAPCLDAIEKEAEVVELENFRTTQL